MFAEAKDLATASVIGVSPGYLVPKPASASSQVWYPLLKRGMDFLLAGICLLLILPALLAVAVLIKLTSRGPVIYSQERLGLDGRPFTIYKLRTMRHNCEKQTGAQWSVPGDRRITPIGQHLRKYKIDELPQLWNVLRGDMSLVGPRPERPEFFAELSEQLPRYAERLSVLPGITGLAQAQLPADIDLASVRRKLSCDLSYVANASLWLDLRILTATSCYMVGMSFQTTRRVFGLPGLEDGQEAVTVPGTEEEALANCQLPIANGEPASDSRTVER